MSLKGNLEEFRFADILQIIWMQKKTGALRVLSPSGQERILFFEDGHVLSARDRRAGMNDPIVRMLVEMGDLASEQLALMERVHVETEKDLFEVLASSRMVSSERIVEMVRRHTQKVFDELSAWARGSYEFLGDSSTLPKVPLKSPLNTEALLLESMRRMDELATIKNSLIPDTSVFERREGATPSGLRRDQVRVYESLDGKRDVRAMVRDSIFSEYEVYEILSELIEAGWIGPAGETGQVVHFPEAVAAPPRATGAWLLLAGMTAISLAVGLFIVRNVDAPPDPTIERIVVDRALANVTFGLEVYRRDQGRYPASIHRLVGEGILRPGDVADFRKMGLAYAPSSSGDAFVLRPGRLRD